MPVHAQRPGRYRSVIPYGRPTGPAGFERITEMLGLADDFAVTGDPPDIESASHRFSSARRKSLSFMTALLDVDVSGPALEPRDRSRDCG